MQHDARWPGRVAVAAAAGSALCTAVGIQIQLAATSAGRPVQRSALSDVAVALLFPAIGALVLRREPRNATGWVLTSCSLVGVSVLAHQWAYDVGVARPGVLPLAGLATWLAAWTYWPYWLQPTLLPVLFPHGRAPSARWRTFTRVVLAVAAVGCLASMLKLDDDVEGLGLSNPLAVPALGPAPVVLQPLLVGLLALIAAPIALVGLARRQRRATGAERDQLQWLLLGFSACLALGLASAALPAADSLLLSLGFAAIPVSVAVAVVRHGMFDVEVVVNRTIVYAILTAASVLSYVAIVAFAAHYAGSSGTGVAAATSALVVAVAASARSRVQRLVDRRLFGARRDPMAVVAQVGASTATAAEPLQALTDAVAGTLRLPFVQLLDEAGAPLATTGEPAVGTHVLPVVDRGRQVGVLVVGRRSRGERLRAEESQALTDVARRAGSLIREAALTADLQQAYERTVLGREEERKRLRRELHDGVGPALAGMALQLDSLASRLGPDPALATRAEELRDRLRGTVAEVRRIVEGLRPAAVDELGLPGALRALAGRPDDSVRVDVDVALPESLPAAVEVAAYRIASEALANALRHARPTRVTVTATLTPDRRLLLTVADDGVGFGADATAGVGLESLHERAREVGGALTVASTPGTGTEVRAVLPLAAEPFDADHVVPRSAR